MSAALAQFVTHHQRSPDEIARLSDRILATLIEASRNIDEANFNLIADDDLARLFDLYDHWLFDGGLRSALGETPLTFRFSQRMTSAGGKTARTRHRCRSTGNQHTRYEIAISVALLYQTFDDDHRPITVTGNVCHNRLEALARIFEHELVHLIEMLLWDKSSCRQTRFQSIAHRLFGHTDYRHALITPREHAHVRFDIKQGDRVTFEYEGRTLEGFVNRITKRASVLVQDPTGPRFSDGKHYQTYYVHVEYLQRID